MGKGTQNLRNRGTASSSLKNTSSSSSISSEVTTTSRNTKNKVEYGKYTIQEIKKHRTRNDAWMVYQKRIYDISNWDTHPGGDVIFTHAGDDATDIFVAFHPKHAYTMLQDFLIGEIDYENSNTTFQGDQTYDVEKVQKQKKFEEGYRQLNRDLRRDGMYNTSMGYYVMKVMTNLFIIAIAGVFNAMNTNGSWGLLIASSICTALFFQQSGWLAHDFLHHQVFEKRIYNDIMGMITGNIWQGFSASWWKNKHNSHHAVPNVHESSPDAHDGDPDIDTMPFLAWSMTMVKMNATILQHSDDSTDTNNANANTNTNTNTNTNNDFNRFMISNQAMIYFPILLVARLSWLLQSFFQVFHSLNPGIWGDKKKHWVQYPKSEFITLIIHYIWVMMYTIHAGKSFTQYGVLSQVWAGFIWFTLSTTICGFFLALVFGLGHNGMKTYDGDKRPDFWNLQVTTTRNITSNWFVDFFCGGLQYQVDHHLFPMLPRHNLKKCHERVIQFCKDNNVTYHETNMWVGTKEVLSLLNQVSEEFIEHFPAM